MFSTFASVISSRNMALLGCSWCNSRRNHVNQQSKTSEDLCGPGEDEDWRFQRPQKTLQKEEFYSQVPRHVTLKKTPKTGKKYRHFSTEFTLKRLGAFKKRIGALRRFKKCLVHGWLILMRPGAWKKCHALCDLRKKVTFVTLSPLENPYF